MAKRAKSTTALPLELEPSLMELELSLLELEPRVPVLLEPTSYPELEPVVEPMAEPELEPLRAA